ncbi:hypothetical protein Tco_0472508 [Tanacetum coccineum]
MLQAQLGHEKGHASCHLLIGCELVTATARTLADGTQQLNATIDSIEYTITEESVRRQLQLADASGINMLQNEEIFAGLQNIGSKSGGWDQFGSNIATALICQPQPSAAPTPSQPVPTPTPSHVQIPTPPITSTPPSTQPPPTLTQHVQSTTPPPQPSSVHLTSSPPPIQPVQPTHPPSPQIPSPPHRNKCPSIYLVSRMESRVESLEKELSDTKQTLGTAVLKLIKKVTKLENKLRQKRKREETEDEEDAEGQDQDIPSQTDQGNKFATPEKSKDSGEAQAEQISPSTLEAAQILTNVASEGFKGSQAPPGSKIYRRKPKSTATPTKVLDFEEPAERPVTTTSTAVNTEVQRREGKAPMTEEDLQAEVQASKKSREPLRARGGLREVEQDGSADSLAEKIQQEEREQYSIEDRAKFLHDTIAAQRKFLTEQRYAAIRNKPPTISQLRNQMITYLKHVANKKHAELKSKSFEEIQVLYERYKKQDQTFVAIGSEEDERAVKKMNEQAADKEKEQKAESVHEEVQEEEGAKKRKLGTRRKLKQKEESIPLVSQEKMMT